MPRNGTKYNKVYGREGYCQLPASEYSFLRTEVSAEATESNNSSNETYVEEFGIGPHETITFAIEDEKVHCRVGHETKIIARISDLPGLDRVLRPCNILVLRSGQRRLYKKWTKFLLYNNIYFNGPFRCINNITGMSAASSSAQIRADRPVPLYRKYIPRAKHGNIVSHIPLDRHCGKNIYHVSYEGSRRLRNEDDDVIYVGSGLIRLPRPERTDLSDDDDDDDLSSDSEDEDARIERFEEIVRLREERNAQERANECGIYPSSSTGTELDCHCAFVVPRYLEAMRSYHLGDYAEQVLLDYAKYCQGYELEIGTNVEVHVCKKYRKGHIPPDLPNRPVTDVQFRCRIIEQGSIRRIQHSVYDVHEIVEEDVRREQGRVELISVNVRVYPCMSRGEWRIVRRIVRFGTCVCSIARKSHMSIRQVHELFIKGPGEHLNNVFGTPCRQECGVYQGNRTGSEEGCVCIRHALTLKDVRGILCDQYGQPIAVLESGMYPIIEVSDTVARVVGWSKNRTHIPNGVGLHTKII
ncbi:hypothetical protein FGB62_47g06 [Gracilaria domingensis]|nr:hypothetical protein FGB62_47g06 [Gracilaria domingensis]